MVALESALSSKKEDLQTFRKFHKDNSSAVFSNYIAIIINNNKGDVNALSGYCLFQAQEKKKQLYMYI